MRLARIFSSLALVLSLFIQLSCSQNSADSSTGGVGVSPAPTGSLVTLPNSVVVVAENNDVTAYSPAGKQVWAFHLPDGDTVAAAPVAALNSNTYIRGAQSLYAIAPDGKLMWQAKHGDSRPAVRGIVPLGDSTVAITSGDTSLVGYSYEGQPRWTFTLPDGDHLNAAPVSSLSSLIYLRGGRRLYAIDSQGHLNWQVDLTESGQGKP